MPIGRSLRASAPVASGTDRGLSPVLLAEYRDRISASWPDARTSQNGGRDAIDFAPPATEPSRAGGRTPPTRLRVEAADCCHPRIASAWTRSMPMRNVALNPVPWTGKVQCPASVRVACWTPGDDVAFLRANP